MPMYAYKCRRCGHEFEVLQKLSEPPLRTCRRCRGRLDKLMSAAAVIYKGSGFYTTDYARKSGGNGGSRDGSGKPEPSSTKDKSEGKSGTGPSED
jgi:putative FmdB family regulatory protein